MVEYTSPNLFKPLHIGNLVSEYHGRDLSRALWSSPTRKVKRLNYPSDIGLTIAKGVWGLQKLKLDPADIAQLGKAYVAGNEAHESDEATKKEIEEINKALYENSNAQWTALREDRNVAQALARAVRAARHEVRHRILREPVRPRGCRGGPRAYWERISGKRRRDHLPRRGCGPAYARVPQFAGSADIRGEGGRSIRAEEQGVSKISTCPLR